jgi:serine phosphatase RsbU (regulator of sigma subunit)
MASPLIEPVLLPVDWPHLQGVDLHARYFSECRGGDFFDAMQVEERILFLLTDIAGPRAKTQEVAYRVQSVFRARSLELFSGPKVNESDAIAELAHAINLSLIDPSEKVRFAPTVLGCFNRMLSILTYCNGGNLLALFREGDKSRLPESAGMPLGLFTHTTFEAAVLAFQEGDALLVTTKGVPESRKGKEEFGVQRVMDLLSTSTSLSASELCQVVLQQAHEFAEQTWWQSLGARGSGHEDLTALALIRRGK